jgi:hypothetical protein
MAPRRKIDHHIYGRQVAHFNLSDGSTAPIYAHRGRLVNWSGDDVTHLAARYLGRQRAQTLTNPRKLARDVRKVRALDRKAQRATGRQADRYGRQADRLRRKLGVDPSDNGRRGHRGGGRR